MRVTLLTTLLSCFALSVAHITGITGPAKYRPTANSAYPLTFTTANGPTTNEDFSVAVGIASPDQQPPGLGSFVHNFDLENTGHGSTGTGNFTLKVPLPADRFSNGNGDYLVTTAVTNAVGANWNVQLLFFQQKITVRGL